MSYKQIAPSFFLPVLYSRFSKVIYLYTLYICQPQYPNSSHSPLPPWCPYICSLCFCPYLCFTNRFIYTIFLDSTYMRSVQFRSVAQSCPTLCDPVDCSMLGLPVHHHLPEFTQTHVHRVSDAIQPSHPLSSPSPLAPNPSQHQSLFQ